MKILQFTGLTASVLLLSIYVSFSQQPDRKKEFLDAPKCRRLLKTNLLPIIEGPIPYTSEFRLVYENSIARKQSIQVGASYLGKGVMLNLIESSDTAYTKYNIHLKVRGFRFQIAYRYYLLSKDEPKWLYVGPMISYSMAKLTPNISPDEYLKIVHTNYNMLFGCQFVIGDAFCIDVFSGIGYKQNAWTVESPKGVVPISLDDLPGYYTTHFKFTIGFNLGLALSVFSSR